jgi:hypothetical protein
MLIVLSDISQEELVRKTLVSSLFTFTDFCSSARRRFARQFELIVVHGGAGEIF